MGVSSSLFTEVTFCSLQAYDLKVARTINFSAFPGKFRMYSTGCQKTDYKTLSDFQETYEGFS